MRFTRWGFGSFLLSVASLACAAPRDDAVVSVTVEKAPRGRTVIYTYRVTNNGAAPVRAFTVGFDHATGEPELTGDAPVLSAPPGWKASIIRLEESDRFEIAWEAQSRVAALRDGRVSPPFRIKTVGECSICENGHWTVLQEGTPLHVTGRFLPRPSRKQRVASPR